MIPVSRSTRVGSPVAGALRSLRPLLVLVALCGLVGPAAGYPGEEDPTDFPGVLLPARTALIKSRHYEQVAEVPLEVGEQVKAGQLLLRFVNDQERVELERARASLEKARTDFERTRRLHEDQGVSDSLLDAAKNLNDLMAHSRAVPDERRN